MSKPIKIMRIIARLNVGGPAIHVILLTERLNQPPEFESKLVCGQVGASEGDMIYLAEQHHVQPMILPGLGREISPRHDIFTIWKLYRLIRKVRPDVVHTHTAKAGFVGRWAAWLARVPVRVHTYHGHVFHGYFSPAKTRLFLWLERMSARISTRLITISPGLKQELVEKYHIAPPEKFDVVPLGFDLEPLASAKSSGNTQVRIVSGLPANMKMVGIVGRLVPIKNHQLFLTAVKKLVEKGENAHFLIVGDGETRPEIERTIAEWNLGEHVTLIGWVQDIPAVLSQLDVLVLTSNNEGTPVSIIEAMAAGVPVVSTAVGGVPDVLEHGKLGQLVPPGDADALANAISRTLAGDHPDVQAAQEAALARYDIGRLAGELGNLYDHLLKKSGASVL